MEMISLSLNFILEYQLLILFSHQICPNNNTVSNSRQISSLTDCQCRVRMAKRIRALQQLLPHSVEGSEASALDDTINRIKFLQLQLKGSLTSRFLLMDLQVRQLYFYIERLENMVPIVLLQLNQVFILFCNHLIFCIEFGYVVMA